MKVTLSTNGENGGIIDSTQNTGVDSDGSTNAELLERGEVSAADRNRNRIRQPGAITEIIRGSLGDVYSSKGDTSDVLGAGESGWISERNLRPAQKVGSGLNKDFLGSIQGVKSNEYDSIGRLFSPEIQKKTLL